MFNQVAQTKVQRTQFINITLLEYSLREENPRVETSDELPRPLPETFTAILEIQTSIISPRVHGADIVQQ